ncbi:hypothetical protein [Trinickia acidisoli]|uniref:hypothetical protein n=1 Tax=Trinickia acidisoli TaxID=2767482 RepID=UPI001A8DED7C|nr:hypothetical protein [Trinickia acidisoli]
MIEPEASTAPDTAHEPGDAAPSLPFDPRQGTLLGFEVPADVRVSTTDDRGPTDAALVALGAPAAPTHALEAAREKPAVPAKVVSLEEGQRPEPAQVQATSSSDAASGASPGAPEPKAPKLLSPGAALASVRQQAARKPAETARTSGLPPADEMTRRPTPSADALPIPPVVAQAAGAASVADNASRALDAELPAAFAQAVASLQEAVVQERRAAEERWRRTRHWLAVALVGLVLLLAVSVVQTVALFGFAHRAQTARQQTQATLNDQQAALASLASSTSALAARMQTLPGAVSAPEAATAAQRPANHVKPAHARHLKEKSKPAAH